MEVAAKLRCLKDLNFFKVDDTIWTECENLASFLQKQRQENESPIINSNLLRELRNFKAGLSDLNGKKIVCAASVVKYCVKHSDKYAICNSVLCEITETIFGSQNNKNSHYNILDLYNKIADSDLWCEEQLEHIDIRESPSLYSNYRNNFTNTEWKKVCFFEFHFAKTYQKVLNYEEELCEKLSYWQKIQVSKGIADDSLKKCEKALQTNQLIRKLAAEEIHGQNCIHNGVTHSYIKLDKSLNDCLVDYSQGCGQCVCVSCNTSCAHSGDIHVIVKLKNNLNNSYAEIAELLSFELLGTHNISATFYIFVKDGTLDSYRCHFCDQGNTHRFQLQCDINSKSQDVVLSTMRTSQLDYNDPKVLEHQASNLRLCELCFDKISLQLNDTLDWRSLDVMAEWIYHVPVEVQLFFSTWFINKKSLKKSDDPRSLLKNKVTRLYALFDTGLSLINRNYQGIIQQLNSEELLVNYHSLTTVFDITASSGCTQSLKTADRWLRMASDPNVSHYETYIKRYPLDYQSLYETEVRTHHVNLKDCFLVFFMDNLVRLSTHEDPDPGRSRTSQVCTLPITFKGLPRNNKITETWHTEDCTDMSTDCKCMDPVKLDKEDSKILFQCTQTESSAWNTFSLQLTWGIVKQAVKDEIFFQFLNRNTEQDSTTSSGNPDDQNPSLICQSEEDHEQVEDEQDLSISNINITTEDTRFEVNSQDVGLIDMDDLEMEFNKSLTIDMSLDEQQFINDLQDQMNESTVHDMQVTFEEKDSVREQSDTICRNDSVDTEKAATDHLLPVFQVPPLLCRHPIPATGRDDSISNIRHVLDDTLQKLDRSNNQKDRIIFAPDHKISQNVIKLMNENSKYQQFLPEFPALHLRKSKIVNLFAAYQKAGLQHLLKFMKDSEQENDWHKLITLQNIETATRNIIRLSAGLHLAQFVQFCSSLDLSGQKEIEQDLLKMTTVDVSEKWGHKFNKFCQKGYNKNATFALHQDITRHCDEIVAITVAERIGGPSGYNLLLASVKKSLPFAFLNGSSSYAAFCVDLLYEHYRAGVFHQNMKMTLFSTPHKEGLINVALDTQREMDHKDAMKAFRPRSTLETVVPRMAIVDHFLEVQNVRKNVLKQSTADDNESGCQKANACNSKTYEDKDLQFSVSGKDWKHIVPVVKLLLRLNAFTLVETLVPQNIYDTHECMLPCEILDSNSYKVGQFLIIKYAATKKLFGLEEKDIPDKECVDGPSVLVKKAMGKSTTLRRITNSQTSQKPMNENDIAEKKRQSKVKRESKVIDCLSSSMNTCQSLINPDGSKSTVQKSTGIKKAIVRAVQYLKTPEQSTLNEHAFLINGLENLSQEIKLSITHANIEFAGIKFRSKATSGDEYILHIENGILRKTLSMFPNVSSMAICEEKYSYTPDDFKSATRKKRTKNEISSIAHLKSGDEILSSRKLSKSAVINTQEGKKMISNYLARNLSKLDLKKQVEITVDSELIVVKCECADPCDHQSYTLPVRAFFNENGFVHQEIINDVHQRKGEAEMAQVDWLADIEPKLKDKHAALSILTSGDIDSVLIHMFALSLHWPRNTDGSFKKPVYILLQKVNTEMYRITDLIEYFESVLGFKYAALNIATICLLGGNDFIPKLHGMSHDKWMSVFLEDVNSIKAIINIEKRNEAGVPMVVTINEDVYISVVKRLYSPKGLNPDELTLDELRQLTIRMPGKKEFRHPTSWMPPYSALLCVVQLLNCQLEYMLCSWDHAAVLPDFLEKGCLVKDTAGQILYNFGTDCHVEDINDLITIDESSLGEKVSKRRKKSKRTIDTHTPQKEVYQKRRPVMSTPVKMKKVACAKSLHLPGSQANMES